MHYGPFYFLPWGQPWSPQESCSEQESALRSPVPQNQNGYQNHRLYQIAPMQLVCPYSRISSPVLFILQHTFIMTLYCSLKEQRVRLAFTTATTAHKNILDKSKVQSLDTLLLTMQPQQERAKLSG